MTWTGATTVTTPVAGDLCCWLTHVGVYIGSGKMISALDPQYGTAVTPVAGNGPPGEPLSYRRVSGAGSTSATAAAVGCLFPIMFPAVLLVDLWRGRDHHRRAEVVGDDQDVVLR